MPYTTCIYPASTVNAEDGAGIHEFTIAWLEEAPEEVSGREIPCQQNRTVYPHLRFSDPRCLTPCTTFIIPARLVQEAPLRTPN